MKEGILMRDREQILEIVKEFQLGIVEEVIANLKKSINQMSKVISQDHGDISYNIDTFAEKRINGLGEKLASLGFPVEITAEGIGKKKYLGLKLKPEYAIIIDPIDGTRGIMYDFRSAFVLTGVAPYRPEGNTLKDITIAVQTEIPISKQDRISILWAIKGEGVHHQIFDLKTRTLIKTPIKTSSAINIDHGYVTFVDFFPGSKAKIGEIADTVIQQIQGKVNKGYSIVFNDQYISNAGQFFLLATGIYRAIVDARPALDKFSGLTSHPYDLCTTLIATEAGAIITDLDGNEIHYPFDTDTKCGFLAYANKDIQKLIEPILLPLLVV